MDAYAQDFQALFSDYQNEKLCKDELYYKIKEEIIEKQEVKE